MFGFRRSKLVPNIPGDKEVTETEGTERHGNVED